MNADLISMLALCLCLAPGLLHAVELVSPLLTRWIVNLVLPLFGFALPSAATSLVQEEQLAMLDAASAAGPQSKPTAVADYVFVMLFEQRQGALAFLSIVVAVIYALTLPLAAREPLHVLLAVMSVLFMLVNANHAGIPFLGHHPRVSRNGRNVGIVFAPYWAVAAVLNGLALA